MQSVDNLYKQFGPRSGPTQLDQNCLPLWSFLNFILKKKKNLIEITIWYAKLLSMPRVYVIRKGRSEVGEREEEQNKNFKEE